MKYSDGPIVYGNVASGATDAGNPVKVGGLFETTPTVVTSGQRRDLRVTSRGDTPVALNNGAGSGFADVGGPGASLAQGQGLYVTSFPVLYNGSTWSEAAGNMDGTVLASAARTASINSADITNRNARGLHLVIDATAVGAAPSIVATIQGRDNISGKYYTILASAAITSISTTVLRVYPGLTAVANLTANDILTRLWRVSVVAGNADSITYSISYSMIL